MTVTRFTQFAFVSALFAFSGCASQQTSTTQTASASESVVADAGELPPVRVVNFDFDSSQLDSGDRAIIDANSKFLKSNPNVTVYVEGHADERGTRAYNLALGERRAKAVAQVLRIMGVDDKRIRVVSYGEEKPIANGHDESAWAQNRRAEIVYRTTTASSD